MNGQIELTMFTPEYFGQVWWISFWIIICLFGVAILLFGVIASLVIALGDYKKFGAKKRRELISLCYGFIFYMIIYAFTLMFGGMSKNKKWEKVSRNTNNNGK